jgi:hypothetical protein
MSSTVRPRLEPESLPRNEASASGVSWPAVIAGAFVAAAISFTLMALGAGMGLSSISPWPHAGLSASQVAPGAIIWIIVVQFLSCALGGYVAGRLRTKWVAVHTHEVFFRDTANGFLTWAVASVVVVCLVVSSASSLVSGTTQAAATVAGVATQTAAHNTNAGTQTDYFVDALFRPAQPNANAPASETRGEAARILATSLTGTIAPSDRTYLAQLVATRAGIPQADAEKRVDDVVEKVRAAEAKARGLRMLHGRLQLLWLSSPLSRC